jgi:ADP-ribose pyrophosphatase
MSDEPLLPEPPRIGLGLVRERSESTRPFLGVRRVELVARHPDGWKSPPFDYDVVTRASLDAAIIVAYERRGGEPHVHVRTTTRAPIALRPGVEGEADLWEVPAGMIDPGESPRETAARELEEELGFRAPPDALVPLGPWTWPLPAVLAEQQHYFRVDVAGLPRAAPRGDGSALERGARLALLPLSTLLAACRAGHMRDAKSELALRRLAEAL